MKQLLNTLFVTSEDIYLSLDGENVVANREKQIVGRWPLHTLQSIVSFSYAGASPSALRAGGFWPASAAPHAAMFFFAVRSTARRTTPRRAAAMPAR